MDWNILDEIIFWLYTEKNLNAVACQKLTYDEVCRYKEEWLISYASDNYLIKL